MPAERVELGARLKGAKERDSVGGAEGGENPRRVLKPNARIVVPALAGSGSGRALSALPEPAKAGTTLRGLSNAVLWSFFSASRAGGTGREIEGWA